MNKLVIALTVVTVGMSYSESAPELLWRYLTDAERSNYSGYAEFEDKFYLSEQTYDIRGYIEDSLYAVGRGPGDYQMPQIWDADVYLDTLYLSVMGTDHIMKFTSSGKFVGSIGSRPTLKYSHGVGVNHEYLWAS